MIEMHRPAALVVVQGDQRVTLNANDLPLLLRRLAYEGLLFVGYGDSSPDIKKVVAEPDGGIILFCSDDGDCNRCLP